MALYTLVCEGHRRGPSRGAFGPGSTPSVSPVGLGVACVRIAGSGEGADDGRGSAGIVGIACGAAAAASAHGTAFDTPAGGSEGMGESWSGLELVPVPVPVPGHGCGLEPGSEAELEDGGLVHEREPVLAVAAFGEKAAGSGPATVTAPVAESGYAPEHAVGAGSEAAAESEVWTAFAVASAASSESEHEVEPGAWLSGLAPGAWSASVECAFEVEPSGAGPAFEA